MRKITLNGKSGRGKVAVVDDEDFERIKVLPWYLHPSGTKTCRSLYPYTNIAGKRVFLHRMVMNCFDRCMTVDHINGDTMDCRRDNLRQCTHAQNLFNKRRYRNNRSGYKGVYRDGRRWIAQITAWGKQMRLGSYGKPKEAAEAYNEAAKKYHGEYARLNVLT